MKRVSLAILVLLLVPHGVYALTMDEAVDMALDNNPRLQDFRYRTEAQRSRVDSRKAPFWPELDATYNYTNADTTYLLRTEEASVFTAEISYNLFRGFSDLNTLKSSRSTLDASRYEQKSTEADVVLDVKRAYIRVLRTRKALEVAGEAVELLERQSRDAERFWRAGLTAKNQFLLVEVALASNRQELLQAETNVRIARKALDRAVGVSLGGDEVIEDLGSMDPVKLDEEALSRVMLANRSELKFLEAQFAAREYARDSIRGRYYPSVDLSFSHSRFGEGVAFDELPDPLEDSDTRAMVEAKWNLFEGWRTKNDILAEESEIRAITERIRETKENIFLQLKVAVEEYRVSAGRIELARKGIEQAEENFRITDNQFRERVATTTDLLDARFLLSRARDEYNNAFYNLNLSLAALERVVEGPVTTDPDGGKPPGN
jgi:outer membrane protein TolC